MKVLFVITKGTLGGAQRYVADLALGVRSAGHEVVLAVGEGGGLESVVKNAGISVVIIPPLGRDVNPLKDLASLRALKKLFIEHDPDVIHLNSSKAGLLGVIAARLVKVRAKVVFTVHGWAFNEDRNLVSRGVLFFLQWLTVALSDTAIAVSQRVALQMAHAPLPGTAMTVIHNGMREPSFLPREEARLRLGIGRHDFVFGTISELHRNKGIDHLLRSFKEALPKLPPEAVVSVIGAGEEEARLKALAAKLGIEARVRWHGFVPDAAELLRAFDVFTLTSRTEAFPYAILEAGWAQLPVIASRVGGIPEAVDHRGSGLLTEPGSTLSIAWSMTELAKDQTMRDRLGAALHEKVREWFTIDGMIQKTLEAYAP
jgi:glycosyltransferase involved in cell wall biosynthesis